MKIEVRNHISGSLKSGRSRNLENSEIRKENPENWKIKKTGYFLKVIFFYPIIRPARTYIQQLCEDTGCCPEDLPRAMNDREEWRERVRDIRAASTI